MKSVKPHEGKTKVLSMRENLLYVDGYYAGCYVHDATERLEPFLHRGLGALIAYYVMQPARVVFFFSPAHGELKFQIRLQIESLKIILCCPSVEYASWMNYVEVLACAKCRVRNHFVWRHITRLL